MLYLWNMNAHGGNKIQIGYFKYKDHKLKRFINWVCVPNMQTLSPTKFMAKVQFFYRQADR